jgi:hypothetical protein
MVGATLNAEVAPFASAAVQATWYWLGLMIMNVWGAAAVGLPQLTSPKSSVLGVTPGVPPSTPMVGAASTWAASASLLGPPSSLEAESPIAVASGVGAASGVVEPPAPEGDELQPATGATTPAKQVTKSH